MRWFCIEVHFLDGRYHGRSDEGRARQWPPNPHRLFQALIAAGHLGFRRSEFSDAKKAALRWLECQGAPEIMAAPARSTNVTRLYVPNNDMDKVARFWAANKEPEKQPNELRTDKDLRPHIVDGDATVRFLWPIADDELVSARAHIEVICEEARHLHALGLGIDLVAGNGRIVSDAEKKALAGEIWIVDEDSLDWRVPVRGSLDELLARYARPRLRMGTGRGAERWVASPAPPTMFREVAYRLRTEPCRRRVHLFDLIQPQGEQDDERDGTYRSFDPRAVIEVAAWFRHAAHQCARSLGFDTDFIENFVCGHGDDAEAKNARFSYLPLPTIPAAGRDGRIRRVLLAEPFGGGGRDAEAVARRLSGASLVEENTGEIKADLRHAETSPRKGIIGRYLGESTVWGSVTPVVLPGRDDYRKRKTHGLILKALAQAGYTTPLSEIQLQEEPIFPGAERARTYRVPAYLKEYPRTYVIITFAKPVPGLVAIGGGRHIGLGTFATLSASH